MQNKDVERGWKGGMGGGEGGWEGGRERGAGGGVGGGRRFGIGEGEGGGGVENGFFYIKSMQDCSRFTALTAGWGLAGGLQA